MRCTLATLALAALAAANPVPQGVTSAIAPSSSAPPGCSPNYSGTFQIQVEKASSKRSISKRQDTALEITLSGGVLTDSQGRTGYIAANNQFQFDKPPQTGAIYTAGFSICANGSLAIGGDAVWYECLSGTFYNLYDDNSAAQCSPIYIVAIGGGAAVTTAGVTTQADGQPTAASAVTQITDGQVQAPTPCTEYVDGQPQCTTAAAPVTQITDGQIQAPTTTAAVCTEYVDGQPQCTTAAAPVTQITDGQVQAPTTTAAVCTEYVDGQPQCTTAAAPVTQITDGQVQAPTTTGAVVTQITDGQIQAPTPCTEYVDGQPQCAPATTVSPCTEYVDGQPQCATSTGVVPTYGSNTTVASPTVSVVPATGAGASVNSLGNQVVGLVAGVLAVAML